MGKLSVIAFLVILLLLDSTFAAYNNGGYNGNLNNGYATTTPKSSFINGIKNFFGRSQTTMTTKRPHYTTPYNYNRQNDVRQKTTTTKTGIFNRISNIFG
uniref:Uncharacterized protein n=1 Tax=Acrobeloides nanus TaxID=290746 RepID=A0A914DNQ0_9BILA